MGKGKCAVAADLCESEARLGYVSSRRAMALSQQTSNNKTTDEEVLRKQREWKVDPGLAEQPALAPWGATGQWNARLRNQACDVSGLFI